MFKFMIIPVGFYNYLREQIRTCDIVKQKVSLTKKGNEYLGKCPFHSEKPLILPLMTQKDFTTVLVAVYMETSLNL